MSDYNIIWKGSPNYWEGRNGEEVVAICYHGTGTPQKPLNPNLADVDTTFANPDREASTHFAISRDGEIHQYVKVKNTAWGNGIMNKPDRSVGWIAECQDKKINPNYRTISIETKNDIINSLPLTEPQYQALLWLSRKLLAENPQIPIDRTGLIGHYQIDNVTRSQCPGPKFPWGRLLAELGGKVTSSFDPNPKGYKVGSGMLAKLTDLKLQAATDEQFGDFGPQLGQRSMLWTSSPGVRLEAFQELDPAYQPTGNWDIRVVKEL